eukprot:GEMP01063900.1.p1 GENE.GEMP01063900.1~~GEMP01063900.1.p1  ORF type:complete len:268 (+),score=74.31 GEMP01063900.1:61-864(+)
MPFHMSQGMWVPDHGLCARPQGTRDVYGYPPEDMPQCMPHPYMSQGPAHVPYGFTPMPLGVWQEMQRHGMFLHGVPQYDMSHMYPGVSSIAPPICAAGSQVTGMADEKRERLLKEAEDEAKQQKSGERWVAKQMHQNANFKKVNSDGVVEENVDDIEMESEAQPLVKAMFSMTKVQRLELSPGGLDPLEVFEALPQEMKTAFESQDVPMLARLQQEMPPDIFGFHLNQCMQSGLWQHPGAHDGDSSDKDEEEEEEKEGVPADVVTDV